MWYVIVGRFDESVPAHILIAVCSYVRTTRTARGEKKLVVRAGQDQSTAVSAHALCPLPFLAFERYASPGLLSLGTKLENLRPDSET